VVPRTRFPDTYDGVRSRVHVTEARRPVIPASASNLFGNRKIELKLTALQVEHGIINVRDLHRRFEDFGPLEIERKGFQGWLSVVIGDLGRIADHGMIHRAINRVKRLAAEFVQSQCELRSIVRIGHPVVRLFVIDGKGQRERRSVQIGPLSHVHRLGISSGFSTRRVDFQALDGRTPTPRASPDEGR